jgi:hypothetical protein
MKLKNQGHTNLGNSPDVPQLMNGLKNVVYVHNGVVFSHKEK